MSFLRLIKILFGLMLVFGLLAFSNLPINDHLEQIRAFTRSIEFNYISWTLNALRAKLSQQALGASDHMTSSADRQVVLDYIDLIREIQKAEYQLDMIYADPNVQDPESASTKLHQDLEKLKAERERLGPLAETVLQNQINRTVADMGLTLAGQAIPPVMYHSSSLPTSLIVSPRNMIRQDYNISLQPDMSADERNALENKVDKTANVSSLVVDIGGIGVYPTMVIQTSDLDFLSEVVAHEWIHNFLTLRPLGVSYFASPELRIMNETTAAIAGKEIGQAVLERYYPELLPPPSPPSAGGIAATPEPPAFDFREEMRETRVTVDQMLAEGKIDEAEAYMEARRKVFWDNGYLIRKLNQAYFAFHGAYADQPGGAAGEDPVGAAVRLLRADSPTLADFINRISWMSSYEQLQRAVNNQ